MLHPPLTTRDISPIYIALIYIASGKIAGPGAILRFAGPGALTVGGRTGKLRESEIAAVLRS